jgi:hypothetical protein
VKCINTPSCNGNFSDSRALRDFLTAELQAVSTVHNPSLARNVDFVDCSQDPAGVCTVICDVVRIHVDGCSAVHFIHWM